MEKYPNGGENKVVETQYSEAFYRLVDKLERLKSRAEDPSLPEEDRKKAQADIEKWGEKFEESFEQLDTMDKEERTRRAGDKALETSKLTGEQFDQKPEGRIFVDSQGFRHSTPEESRANEPDDWRKTS